MLSSATGPLHLLSMLSNLHDLSFLVHFYFFLRYLLHLLMGVTLTWLLCAGHIPLFYKGTHF